MTAVVLRGDAARLPLPDGSADLIVCSPPYFGLRSYADTCRICLDIRANGLEPAETIVDYDAHVRRSHHYDGQIGSEATPREYLAALVACTREWVRVLKPSGSIFVNLGDKYAGSGGDGNSGLLTPKYKGNTAAAPPSGGNRYGHAPKSLMGLPWRYALACMDDLGLILRRDIIWHKPNGLPESVTDRCRSSHEYLFHFTKLPRYFAAVDEIREPHTGNTHPRRKDGQHTPNQLARIGEALHGSYLPETYVNPLGKLPGSVWSIPSAPLVVPASLGIDHFAAYPPELCRRIILGWSPPGVCTACGEGRRPVTERTPEWQAFRERHGMKSWHEDNDRLGRGNRTTRGPSNGAVAAFGPKHTITGYACACPQPDAPTRPALVVDPFGGTGTTALTAAAYGRTGVTVDRSADYCRLARWRTHDPGERARALGVPKPPPVPDGQGSLFDDEAV